MLKKKRYRNGCILPGVIIIMGDCGSTLETQMSPAATVTHVSVKRRARQANTKMKVDKSLAKHVPLVIVLPVPPVA